MRGARNTTAARASAVPIEAEIERRGIKLRGRVDRSGPCPKCGGVDRFSINVQKQVFNCRGCEVGGDVVTLVQHLDGVGFAAACDTLLRYPPALRQHFARGSSLNTDYLRDQHRKAAWLWSRRRPIAGTPAERYVRDARGITCPMPSTIGYLPPHKPTHHPALISAFAIVDETEPGIVSEPRGVISVHLTLLRLDGSGKADLAEPKIIIGSPGSLPIVLSPPNDLLGLAVTEGVEDGLSALEATGLGVWVAGNAGRMPSLAVLVPPYIETTTIFAHRDESGQTGARALADALVRIGIEVFVEGLPP
jgi:hypothetical protein